MNQELLQQLTPEDKAALVKVAELLKQARETWNLIEGGKQCELNDVHNEDASLAHCLRWGEQAAFDLVELTQEKQKC